MTNFGGLPFINQKKRKKVIRMVSKYNCYAKRWGFEPIDYNVFELVFNSFYTPKHDEDGASWYQMFQTELQNRYMSRLWDKIWDANFKLCYN